MSHSLRMLVLAAAAALVGIAPARGQEVDVEYDGVGDAVVRRTDPGNDGPLHPAAVLPDLVRTEIMGWLPASAADPYTGSVVDEENADIFRLNIVLSGLVNPPCRTDSAAGYDPFAFGPSPLLGYIELNVDRNRETGGQPTGAAALRYLANVARFGGYPSSDYEKACGDAGDRDVDYLTMPFFERSGEEFSLAFCGCETPVVVSAGGNGDQAFEAGETWIIEGRFFKRAAGYAPASLAQGGFGTQLGQYEPLVRLRFSHSAAADQTTVSLVFPLTMRGASILAGQPEQPIDTSYDNGNHSSIQEAVQDLINGASGENVGPLFGLTHILTDPWRQQSATGEVLDPTRWRINALVGTAYAAYQGDSDRIVLTDVGFDELRGDLDGDGLADAVDLQALEQYIAATDGTWADADGVVDGRCTLPNFAYNFSVYDLDGDGVVGPLDAAFYTGGCPGDWDGNGTVNSADISAFLTAWLASVTGGTLEADFDGGGSVNSSDISAFLGAWLGCL